MSENSYKNSYVCPECYCADGWKTISQNDIKEAGNVGGLKIEKRYD
jgi:hypothetical protein